MSVSIKSADRLAVELKSLAVRSPTAMMCFLAGRALENEDQPATR